METLNYPELYALFTLERVEEISRYTVDQVGEEKLIAFVNRTLELPNKLKFGVDYLFWYILDTLAWYEEYYEEVESDKFEQYFEDTYEMVKDYYYKTL